MEQKEKTRKLLIKHYHTYPQLQIQDIFKFLYQSSFGCEHMVSSSEAATEYIREEKNSVFQSNEALIDDLDGAYSRVHLTFLNRGLSVETLGKLFFASAKSEPTGKSDLEYKLKTARELVREGVFSFSSEDFEKAAEEWRSDGYPAIHHSEVFREKYHPSYRVIANNYVTFMPLFAKLDKLLETGPAVIAVEGGSASGKTTLSAILEKLYGCTVLHMDDFFLRPEQRTVKRYAEAGGNVDRERFLEEVLIPLSKNEPINYRKFDCSTFTLTPSATILPEKLTVIEGAYSMHPELADYYDFSVFLDISPEIQRARIQKRNSPQSARQFFDKWIPLEERYFSELKVKERCNMSINISNS